jgi:hypothetical protein
MNNSESPYKVLFRTAEELKEYLLIKKPRLKL